MSPMWPLLLILLLQLYFDRSILDAEDARVEQPAELLAALKNPDPRVQRLAVRAIGRLERNELAESVRPLVGSPDEPVRMEAINALGQMNASIDAGALAQNESQPAVRAVIYETAGRLREAPANAEILLVNGLKESNLVVRTGAAKGLEAFFRTHRNTKPSPETLAAVRQAFKDNADATIRELLM